MSIKKIKSKDSNVVHSDAQFFADEVARPLVITCCGYDATFKISFCKLFRNGKGNALDLLDGGCNEISTARWRLYCQNIFATLRSVCYIF